MVRVTSRRNKHHRYSIISCAVLPRPSNVREAQGPEVREVIVSRSAALTYREDSGQDGRSAYVPKLIAKLFDYIRGRRRAAKAE